MLVCDQAGSAWQHAAMVRLMLSWGSILLANLPELLEDFLTAGEAEGSKWWCLEALLCSRCVILLFGATRALYCGVAPSRSLRMCTMVETLLLGLPSVSCSAGFSVPATIINIYSSIDHTSGCFLFSHQRSCYSQFCWLQTTYICRLLCIVIATYY